MAFLGCTERSCSHKVSSLPRFDDFLVKSAYIYYMYLIPLSHCIESPRNSMQWLPIIARPIRSCLIRKGICMAKHRVFITHGILCKKWFILSRIRFVKTTWHARALFLIPTVCPLCSKQVPGIKLKVTCCKERHGPPYHATQWPTMVGTSIRRCSPTLVSSIWFSFTCLPFIEWLVKAEKFRIRLKQLTLCFFIDQIWLTWWNLISNHAVVNGCTEKAMLSQPLRCKSR